MFEHPKPPAGSATAMYIQSWVTELPSQPISCFSITYRNRSTIINSPLAHRPIAICVWPRSLTHHTNRRFPHQPHKYCVILHNNNIGLRTSKDRTLYVPNFAPRLRKRWVGYGWNTPPPTIRIPTQLRSVSIHMHFTHPGQEHTRFRYTSSNPVYNRLPKLWGGGGGGATHPIPPLP